MANKFLQVAYEGRVVTFTLGNGRKLVCDIDELNDDMRAAAMVHGVNQKVRDSAAGYSKDGDFAGAMRAMSGTWDNLVNGLWNAKGTSGESDLVAAVAELKGLPIDEAAAIIDGLDDDQMKALRGKPTVKAKILEIKAARAAKVAEAADDEDDILDL